MEEPRSRRLDLELINDLGIRVDEDLIIDDPKRVKATRRLADTSITLMFWMLQVYLWQPLISMIAWAFKINVFYDHMIVLGGYAAFSELLFIYAIIITVLGCTLIFWARVNQWRFRGKEKRKFLPRTSISAKAQYHQIETLDLAKWTTYKNCRVFIDESGQVQTVEQNLPAANSNTHTD